MLTNNNSYPLFIKGFCGFKIVQKERGYYYDKTLKHRIWLYTVNLRRNSFFTLKELIPLKSFVNKSSICILENIETKFRTNKSDITNYQRSLLHKTRFHSQHDLNFYKRLIHVKNALKKNVLLDAPFTFTYYDHNKYKPTAFTNRGAIKKLNKRSISKFYLYRFMLKRSPVKFWNFFPFFLKTMDYLLNRFTLLNFTDFLLLFNMLFKKKKLTNYIRKRRPWNGLIFTWNNLFSKIMSLKSLLILKISNKIKSGFWTKLATIQANLPTPNIWKTIWLLDTNSSTTIFKKEKSKKKLRLSGIKFLRFFYKEKKRYKSIRKRRKVLKFKKSLKRTSIRRKSIIMVKKAEKKRKKNTTRNMIFYALKAYKTKKC